jgi:starvation-inducible DNA-binding protein
MAARTETHTNGRRRSNSVSPEPRLDAKAPQIQAFGTLRSLPIGLPDKARISSCAALNEILADSMVLYALYKKHHWLVAGPTFYQLHLLFDKHAAEQVEIIDQLAERVRHR